ncbi:MAG: universal stress protein [Bacteroidia bacterium]|nr:universal stress protein [Bacteroidia bacterium]NNM23814.1 universal stress protein [Flavobacteriaceae bacterium]
MTNVLIPTDFSDNSWNATSYALQFFSVEPVNFYLLNVNIAKRQEKSGDTRANAIIFDTGRTKGLTDKLEETRVRIEKNFPDTNHRFYVLQEHTFFIDGIRRCVQKYRIDFIVMGTKGATGLKEATIGTRTGEVITRIKCPTLVIPENAEYEPPKTVVFPTDFNNFYKNKILMTLAEIIAMHDSKIRVLHISKSKQKLTTLQKENKSFLEDFLEDHDHSFHTMSDHHLEDALDDFVQTHNIEMIAMVAKNINFFERLLFKPSVAKISYHTHIPFLVLHE